MTYSAMFWPCVINPGLDPTGRLAAIRQLADPDSPFCDWAHAMLEHTSKHTALGWPLHTAMQYASKEVQSHLPKDF